MKKGISNIIVLALVIVNLVLTVILVFTFLPSIKKTNNLVAKICDMVDLEVGADSNKQEVTVSDLTSVTVLFGEDTTNVVNLTNGKLAKFGATINLNTKAKDYESVKTQVESAMSMIDSTLMGVIRGFDSTTPQADMEKAATNAVRELFASDTVYSVSFTQYVVQ